MLNIEIVKFEVEDVITTSGGSVIKLPDCSSGGGHSMSFMNVGGTWQMACSKCGYTGSASGGSTIIGGGG